MSKTVRYFIDVDSSGAIKGGRSAEDALEKIDNQSQKTGLSTIALGNVFAQVATQMASHIADLPGRIFELATSAEETGSKYNTVFGPSVGEVNEFLDEFAVKAGLSNTAAQELTSRAGAVAQGFGYSTQGAAKLATSIAELSGDLTSFNNIPIEETSNAVISALSGERESLKRMGIVINEVDVVKQALNETGKKNADQLTKQERAAATLSLIYERAGVAVGDLDRTQDSAANTYRRVQAGLQNVAQELSTEFLPLLSDGVSFFEEILDSEQFDQFMNATKLAIQNMIVAIDFLKVNAGASIDAIWAGWEWLQENIATLFINLVTMAKNYVLNLPEIFWNGIKSVFRIFDALLDYSIITTKNILQAYKELGVALLAALTDPLNAREKIDQAFNNLLEVGKSQISNFGNLGSEIANTLHDNFEANATIVADGLIAYDNSAFNDVEFKSWAEVARGRLEEELSVSPSVTPTINSQGETLNPDFQFDPLEVSEVINDFEIPELGINWSKELRIPDGTIDTLNKNLATIDLMPDSSIEHLNQKLGIVKEMYVTAQTDSERERLSAVEQSISYQIEAREMGIDVERAQMEDWLEEQTAMWNDMYSVAGEYVNVFGQLRQQEMDKQISRVDEEAKRQIASINSILKIDSLSAAERKELIERRSAIEERAEMKKQALKREAFEKEKVANILMAVAETALAVTEALPNIPLSIAVGVLGALQVAVVARMANPYLKGGLIEERLHSGKSKPGKKLISINENGAPEYIVNAESTKKFKPVLDLINYQPQQVRSLLNQDYNDDDILIDVPVRGSLLAGGTLEGQSLPLLEARNHNLDDAIKDGFENLKITMDVDGGRRLVAYIEKKQGNVAKDTFN